MLLLPCLSIVFQHVGSNGSLDAILQRHELETEVRALAARRRQIAISERCMALAARVQVLRNRGYALSGDEDDLGAKLAALERGAQDPALAARMEELWSRLITLRDYAESLQGEISKGALAGDQGGLGEEVEAKAKKVRFFLVFTAIYQNPRPLWISHERC